MSPSCTDMQKLCARKRGAFPLFKALLTHRHNWWHSGGFCGGKSVDDGVLNQVFYYSNNTIMVYSTHRYAEYWNEKFSADSAEDDEEAVGNAVLEMISEIQKLHGKPPPRTDVNSPEAFSQLEEWPFAVHYKYWKDGGYKWARNVNVAERIADMQRFVTATGGILYSVGDSVSTDQGWIEGALSSADKAIDHILKL